jgi:hypothetical protein
MSRLAARTPRLVLLLAVVLLPLWGCGEPPHKEMNQAQGAIDAAHAAGAGTFAAQEIADAEAALARAEAAAGEGDYRLALSQALDARERARTAAREAATRQAEARSDAERALQALDTVLATADTRAADARGRNVPARVLAPLDVAVADARTRMQEARTALEAQRYAEVTTAAVAAADGVKAALEEFDRAAAPPTPARPVRRPR